MAARCWRQWLCHQYRTSTNRRSSSLVFMIHRVYREAADETCRERIVTVLAGLGACPPAKHGNCSGPATLSRSRTGSQNCVSARELGRAVAGTCRLEFHLVLPRHGNRTEVYVHTEPRRTPGARLCSSNAHLSHCPLSEHTNCTRLPQCFGSARSIGRIFQKHWYER